MLGATTIDRERSRSRSPRKNDFQRESNHKKEIKEENEKKEDKKRDNIGLGAKSRLKSMSIQMKLGAKKESNLVKPKLSVAAAFNQDSDSEPEEMPPEAKMRMRNIGRYSTNNS